MGVQGIDAYGIEGLGELVVGLGAPSYRAKQLLSWLYGHSAASYDQMTNLPKSLRERLADEAPLHFPTVASKLESKDSTRKYVVTLDDGLMVETVGIPSHETGAGGTPKRLSVCVSSQVGCPIGCTFCATGAQGFSRNLTPGEIVQQVLVVQEDFGQKASSVVLMGQGEPFLNYDNVLDALRILNAPDAVGIGARHLTVSTCGTCSGIEAFGEQPEQFVLAVSLHSARQDVRNSIMPHCSTWPLDELHASLEKYQRASGRRITFEYLLLKGLNDADADLRALIEYCQGLKAHVNLLPYNVSEDSSFAGAGQQALRSWESTLDQAGIEATVRTSRGADIHGACGQLKNSLN